MNTLTYTLALLLCAIIATPLAAQQGSLVPLTTDEATAAAYAAAESLLGPDARLVLIGAKSDLVVNGEQLEILIETGESSAWAYYFSSKTSEELVPIAVVKLAFAGLQAMQVESPVPVTSEVLTTADTTLPFFSSVAMSEIVVADTAWLGMVERGERPRVLQLALRGIDPTWILPALFPTDAPVWSIDVRRADGSERVGILSTRTGHLYWREGGVAGVAEEDRSPGERSLR